MDEKDIELKLLHGSPINVGIGKLHPLTLAEIENIGENKYNQYLSISLYEHKEEVEIEDHKFSSFEIVTVFCLKDENFKKVYLESLSKFFKEEVYFQDGLFYLGKVEDERYIDEQKYEEIKFVLKKQNFIKDRQEEEKDEFNPHDEKAKELIEQIKKFRQKVKEKNKEEGLSLSDIISIVSSYAQNLNIFSVWNLTVFQLYTIYIRLMMRDNYEQQFAVYLQGADPKDLDLKHWARKINND